MSETKMSNVDVRNIVRNKCTSCDDCSEFLSIKGAPLFGYCSCAPRFHEAQALLEPVAQTVKEKVNSGSSSTGAVIDIEIEHAEQHMKETDANKVVEEQETVRDLRVSGRLNRVALNNICEIWTVFRCLKSEKKFGRYLIFSSFHHIYFRSTIYWLCCSQPG